VTEATPVEVLDDNGKVLLKSNAFYVAPEADPRTQLVEVKSVFQNTIGLRPSELVRTRIVYATQNALTIPMLAVIRQSGQPFAFVVAQKDGKTVVERRPISLGALGESSYVVTSGLKPGEQIAVSGLQALKDGAVIKPKPLQTAALGGSGAQLGGDR
jgi:multidrug efflux pump subunit AcrA (membrane-fusion protein)